MLVLSRQVDESIVINDNIIITVLAVDGERVKIGIQAPREILVLRKELWMAGQEQEQTTEDSTSGLDFESDESPGKFLSEQTSEDPSEEGE